MFGLRPFTKRRHRPAVTNDELRDMAALGNFQAAEVLRHRLARASAAANMNRENVERSE